MWGRRLYTGKYHRIDPTTLVIFEEKWPNGYPHKTYHADCMCDTFDRFSFDILKETVNLLSGTVCHYCKKQVLNQAATPEEKLKLLGL